MPPKPLTRREMDDLATSLRALLDVIRRDEMTASTATTYRLEGAVVALQAAPHLDRDVSSDRHYK
ncbi:MAG: hypothetical protein ACYCST_20650 [Acidimicrobiales bacterium]